MKENKHDSELAASLVPAENEKTSMRFEDLLMEKIIHEAETKKALKQKKNYMVSIILTVYISLILLTSVALLIYAEKLIIPNTIHLSSPLNTIIFPENSQLIYYKILGLVSALSLISFGMHFVQLRTRRSLAYK